jgi:DNA polymerase-3 subunit epsilon
MAAEAILTAIPLRTCTARISVRATAKNPSPCVLAEMGRCGAPCDGRMSVDDYTAIADQARQAIHSDPRFVISAVQSRMADLVSSERFEDAALWRDRLSAFLRGAARQQRLQALMRIDELVAAAPTDDRGWHIHIIRNGRLAAAGVAARGTDPHRTIAALRAATHDLPAAAHDGALVEECEVVLRWLESPTTRLVHTSHDFVWPIHSASGFLDQLAPSITRDPEVVFGAPTSGWGTERRPLATLR